MKPLFAHRPSSSVSLLLCVIASLGLLACEKKSLSVPLRDWLSTAIYPLQQLVNAPVQFINNMGEVLSSHTRLLAENDKLRHEQLLLNAKLLKFAALEQENLRLRGLLDTSFKLGEQAVIAELLSVNRVSYEHVVVVNKGSRFGVYQGQPVLDAHGVVGQVLRANPNNAEVILVTDPNHAIPVEVNRNGLRTIAQGTGQADRLSLPFLVGNADLQAGDVLVTSGMGGVFPQGYPVAVMAKETGEGAVALVAKPIANLDRDRELLLVWNNPEPIPRVSDPPKTPGAERVPQ